MKCEITNCPLDALILVIFDDEKYKLCRRHLELEDEDGIRIFRHSAIEISSLTIPA